MSLRPRSPLSRLAVVAATATMVAAATIAPAVADDDWDSGDPGHSRYDDGFNQRGDDDGDNFRGDRDNPRLYKGRVTARDGLRLRSAPTRGSRTIRIAPYGEIVRIFCKTPGQTVDRNNLWYLLTDGTWAWGAARYIDNIGPAPRWC
ncbi:hypothetical protein OK074_5593 [Actinobacteria bacterium OK074]|nr:hypothetical protein OK074_5593 [Actinobacteria bacterium OK074]